MAILIWSGKKRDLDDERIEFPEEYFLSPRPSICFALPKWPPRRNDRYGYVAMVSQTQRHTRVQNVGRWVVEVFERRRSGLCEGFLPLI